MSSINLHAFSDSGNSNIGKTKRHLVTRMNEHVTPKESNKSEIKEHIFDCHTCKNSNITVDNFNILKPCKDDYITRISEALLIKKYRPKMNKQMFTKGQSYLLRVFWDFIHWLIKHSLIYLTYLIFVLFISDIMRVLLKRDSWYVRKYSSVPVMCFNISMILIVKVLLLLVRWTSNSTTLGLSINQLIIFCDFSDPPPLLIIECPEIWT